MRSAICRASRQSTDLHIRFAKRFDAPVQLLEYCALFGVPFDVVVMHVRIRNRRRRAWPHSPFEQH